MKNRIFAALVVFVSLCCGTLYAQHPVKVFTDPALEKHLTETLHRMYEAEKRGDLAFILSQMADDFTEIGGDGLIYRVGDIKEHFHEVKLKSYSLQEMQFHQMTPDSAYVSYLLTVDATFQGKQFPGKFRIGTVWTRVDDKWLVRFEQGTVIPERTTGQ